MRRFSTIVALFAALALVTAACGEDADTGLPPNESPLPSEEPGGSGDIEVVDNDYEPKDFTAKVGEPVTWFQTGTLPHTVTASDGSFDSHPDCTGASGCMLEGDTYEHTFEEPGEYVYYCRLHGTKDGANMAGTVTVEA